MVVARGLDPEVSEPAVGVDDASGLNGFPDERHQALPRRPGCDMRSRLIPGPSSCAAITISALRSAWRPRVPSSTSAVKVSSTSTRPVSRLRPGRTIARRNLGSQVQAVL